MVLTFYRADTMPDSAGLVPDSAGLNDLSETEEKVFSLISNKTTRKEIQEKLLLSERMIRKILSSLQEKDLIEKIGKGPATYYKKK